MMVPIELKSQCHKLEYVLIQDEARGCRNELKDILQIKITEVFGTSAIVKTGEKYVVRGDYTLTGEDDIGILVNISGTAGTYDQILAPGEGHFEVACDYCVPREPGPYRCLFVFAHLTPNSNQFGKNKGLLFVIELQDSNSSNVQCVPAMRPLTPIPSGAKMRGRGCVNAALHAKQ